MIDASQPFLEDKKQTLALDGGDDPVRLILAYFSTDNENIDELEKLKYNQTMYRRLGWQDGSFKALFRLPDPQYKFVKKKTLAGKMLRPATIYSAVSRELLARKSVGLRDTPEGWQVLARALRALGREEEASLAEAHASVG